MRTWYAHEGCSAELRSAISNKSMLLVGPSGSGKTTICEELCRLSSNYTAVRNTTTRLPRPTDPSDHFEYVTEQRFKAIAAQKELLFARLAPEPYYGYRLSDVQSRLKSHPCILFMFRSSGLEHFLNLQLRPKIVILTGNPLLVTCHSQDDSNPSAEIDVDTYLRNNLRLASRVDQSRVKIIRNRYLGSEEIRLIAQSILDWMPDYD